MTIKNFAQAHKILRQYVPPAGSAHQVYSLERMRKLVDQLGNPQNNFKVIHVAGTSGKTSTSYFIAQMLKNSGQKVGLTVSPHIDEVNERVQINLEPLSEAKFCAYLSEFMDLITQGRVVPTYFELLVAFAYWVFTCEKVDYAVVEVGLGGLLDGTNVIDRADKVCVITDIGLDHVQVLGETIEEIAAQKAGIIQSGNQVFALKQGANILKILRANSTERGGKLEIIQDQAIDVEIPKELPLFQRRNWALAVHVYDFIAKRDGLSTQAKITVPIVPARMEIVKIAGKTIVMDGAHNSQKMQALVSSMKARFPNQPIATLLALVNGPDFKVRTDIKSILELSDQVIVTSFGSQQDLLHVSVDSNELIKYCQQFGFKNVRAIEDPKLAFKELLKQPEPVLLVTGSFYLMNHIRPLIFN